MGELEDANDFRPGTVQLIAAARAAGHPDPEALTWDVVAMPHKNIIDTTGGLYEVHGRPMEGSGLSPWLGVLKVLRRSAEGECDPPSSWCYWRREAEFYASALPRNLPSSMRAPLGYGVGEEQDSCWIVMEHVAAGAIQTWDIDDYYRVAVAAGESAGVYLGGREPPRQPWLVDGFLRSVLDPGGVWAAILSPDGEESVWALPLVQASFGPSATREAQELWGGREALLGAVHRLPRVFCHNDLHRRNVVLPAARDEAPVAVDWAFCGPGPVGTDPAHLVGGTLYFCDVDLDRAEALESAVYTGYLDGIKSRGWEGDDRLVRLGFTVSMALWQAATMPGWVGIMLPEEEGVDVEGLFGRPRSAVNDAWVGLQGFAMERAREALALCGSLGL